MNRFNIQDFLGEKLKGTESSFKETSYDEANDKYLCADTTAQPVFDFDKYVAANFDRSRLPASPDAIYIRDKTRSIA